MTLFQPDLSGPDVARLETILVDVEVLGSVAHVRWSPTGVDGDPVAMARLRHIDADLEDPVQFLLAVRTAFGDGVHAHLSDQP